MLLPSLPENTLLPIIDMWEDIRSSFVFGQYAASLALVGSFLEHILETAASSPEGTTLNGAIKHAREQNLISEQQEEKLLLIKETVRNPYSHGNYDEIAGKAPVTLNLAIGKLPPGMEPMALELGKSFKKRRNDITYARPTLQ
jgi:hypothetical protein